MTRIRIGATKYPVLRKLFQQRLKSVVTVEQFILFAARMGPANWMS